MDVHHVTGFVFFHRDLLVMFWGESHVGESVFGGKEGCGEIVIAVGDEDLHVGVAVKGSTKSITGVGELVLRA